MGVDNAQVARRYMTELWGKGNVGLIDELCADDIELRDLTTPPRKGKDEVRAWMEMLAKDFADNQFTIEEIIVSGDRVVVRNTWSAVVKGELFGIDAAGVQVRIPAVQVLRIKNGKVIENISYSDSYTLLRQLGALPPLDQFKAEAKEPASKPQPSVPDRL
jgi:steroid delta-isomerase-like uncharacterized protein